MFGNVLGGISQPIFQGKKVRTDFEVAKIEREKSEVALQQTILEAVNEVTNNLVIVDKQKEQLRFAEERVQNAQLAVKNQPANGVRRGVIGLLGRVAMWLLAARESIDWQEKSGEVSW